MEANERPQVRVGLGAVVVQGQILQPGLIELGVVLGVQLDAGLEDGR
jgi:hypothetical protein